MRRLKLSGLESQHMQRELVLYHKGCPDGLYAAAALFYRIAKNNALAPVEFTFIALDPSNTLENVVFDGFQRVYVLDLSLSAAAVTRLIESVAVSNAAVVLIDHHKTTVDTLPIYNNYQFSSVIFDQKHSAAWLAFEYFNPGVKVPEVVQFVEQRDLYKFTLPLAREITSALDIMARAGMVSTEVLNDWLGKIGATAKVEVPLFTNPTIKIEDKTTTINLSSIVDFRFMYKLMDTYELPTKYREGGELIMDVQNKAIADLKRNGDLVLWSGNIVALVNASCNVSDLGASLYTKGCGGAGGTGTGSNPIIPDYAFIWRYDQKSRKVYVSLRSDPAKFDCTTVAKKFGGGGHPGASGFEMSMSDFIALGILNAPFYPIEFWFAKE